MNTFEARIARGLRLREAAELGIRVVPVEPDPREFPAVRFACERRPRPCRRCTLACDDQPAIPRKR